MAQPRKNHRNKDQNTSRPMNLLERTVRYLVSFPPYYLPIRIVGAIFLLLLVIGNGDLLTSVGFISVLGILIYLLLIYLSKWFEKKEK